jgi:hypothetical protein
MPQDFGGVMHEFKHGQLHSGSKHGPKVTSLQQAKAIAASEDKKYKGKGGIKATKKQKKHLTQGYGDRSY